jgi:hypothetical protein
VTVNRNTGYIIRHVRYFHGMPGHASALVFTDEIIDVTDTSTLYDLTQRPDFVGLIGKAPKTAWSGMTPRIEHDGASHVVKCATKAEAADAVRAEAKALRVEADRVEADPAYAAEKLLKSHDWYAHMSDDYGVCAASDHHMDKIRTLLAQLPSGVAEALLAKYRPTTP